MVFAQAIPRHPPYLRSLLSENRFLCPRSVLTLTACSSAPTHYYTLMPATDSPITQTVVPFQYELTTVNVPAQVDQPQIVVRQGEWRPDTGDRALGLALGR
jgi:uncharacterized lipoprotein YmbA